MQTIKQTAQTIYETRNRYVFDEKTENKLKEIGIIPSDSYAGQYHNKNQSIYLYAEENNKYFLSVEYSKRDNETFEDFLIKSNEMTALAIKINEILK